MNALTQIWPPSLWQIPLLLAAGALLGWIHFRALRWNTRLFLHSSALWHPILLLLARTGLTVLALYFCARHGLSLPLILLGFLVGRQLVIRKEKKA